MPWHDRTHPAYVATDSVLSLDDAVLKIGLPLWIVHVGAPHGLAPPLMVLNNVMVAALLPPSPLAAPPWSSQPPTRRKAPASVPRTRTVGPAHAGPPVVTAATAIALTGKRVYHDLGSYKIFVVGDRPSAWIS
jgi:hypothetical protein